MNNPWRQLLDHVEAAGEDYLDMGLCIVLTQMVCLGKMDRKAAALIQREIDKELSAYRMTCFLTTVWRQQRRYGLCPEYVDEEAFRTARLTWIKERAIEYDKPGPQWLTD
jgi:hypothetical protein